MSNRYIHVFGNTPELELCLTSTLIRGRCTLRWCTTVFLLSVHLANTKLASCKTSQPSEGVANLSQEQNGEEGRESEVRI